jgi:hypothetical protein
VARPRHPDAVKFLKTGLFDDLDSFSTLEKRVSELPTPQDRGMAFEMFAEGYFSTSRQAQARHVWPSNAVPTAVKKKLGLPTPEIHRTVSGVSDVIGEISAGTTPSVTT